MSLIAMLITRVKIMFDKKIVVVLMLILKLSSTTTIQEQLETYEQYVNTSQLIEKEDKARISAWSEELQVKLVDITTKYRLQMTRHQQHSFRKRPSNGKWQDCLKFYHNATTKLEQAYYVKENECLKGATSADGGKRQAVSQVGREIRKWRRTYRYLINLCHSHYPDDEENYGICLVKYMERDNYSHTFERLITLRLEVVQQLHEEMVKAVQNLEECLKNSLSTYLERVRSIMEVLSRCYGKS